MRAPFPLVFFLTTLLLAAPSASIAQVYKWVDDKGVVNYGDKPPARQKAAQPLADNNGSVSVVPGIPKEEMDQMRQRDMQRRVQQLEREVDDLRARNATRESVVTYPVPADVYVPAYAYDYGYGYGGGYARRAPPVGGRPGHHPEPPIASQLPQRPPRGARGVPTEPVPNTPAFRGHAGRG